VVVVVVVVVMMMMMMIIIITEKQSKYKELGNEIVRDVEAKHSTSDPDSNIIFESNSKVTITKSKEM